MKFNGIRIEILSVLNEGPVGLYRSLGFKVISEIPGTHKILNMARLTYTKLDSKRTIELSNFLNTAEVKLLKKGG